MFFSVFISYSTTDIALVQQVQARLKGLDIDVFVAEYDVRVGDPLSDKIKAAITNRDLFLLLWSKQASKSQWVQQEIAQALAEKKLIVAVVLDDGVEIPLGIQGIKYLKAYEKTETWVSELESIVKHHEAQDQLKGLAFIGTITLALAVLARRS